MERKSFFARLSGDSTATFVGFALLCAIFLAGVWLTHRNTHRLADANGEVEHTRRVDLGLERLLSTLKDAETAQRGFVITGNPVFLEPYDAAIERVWTEFDELKRLTADNAAQQDRLDAIRLRVEAKLAELKMTIELRRTDADAAAAAVASRRGMVEMDAVRKSVAEMQAEESRLLAERTGRADATLRLSNVIAWLAGVLGLLMILAVFALVRRNDRLRVRAADVVAEQKERLRTTLASIGDGVISTDRDGSITYLNAVAEELTGWSNADAAGVPLTRVFHIVNESTRQPVENPALRALKEGVIVGLANHTVLIAKDGTERPIEDSASPIRCADGEIVGCVLIFRDVSERKREEIARAERTRLISLRADIASAISAPGGAPAALQFCCEALVRHLDAAFARIWTLDDVGAVLELQASAGLYTHLDGPHGRVPVGEFKIGRIAASRKPHLSNNVPDNPEVGDRAWAAREGMVAFAGYPLVVEDRVVGVVALFARRPLTEGILTELAPLAEGIAQYLDRRRLDELFRDQAERLRTTLASIGDGVISTDRDGLITYLNAVAEQLTGWSNAVAAGVPLTRVFHIVNESTRQPVENPALRALKEGVIVGLANHTVLIAKDGTEWPIEDSAGSIRSREGEIVGCVLVFRDVSEKKRAEAQIARGLAASERQRRLYETILNSTPDLVYVLDLNHRFTYANRALLALWGRTRDDAVGKNCLELGYEPWHAAMHDREIDAVVATKRPIRGEVPFVGVGGRRVYDYLFVPVINADGEVEAITGTTRDITERKCADEERLRLVAIIEYSADFIGSFNTAGQQLFLNRAGRELIGLSPDRDIRETAIPDYFVPAQRRFVDDVAIPSAMADGRWSGELTFRHFVTGEPIPVLYDLFRIDDSLTGQAIHFATIARDISEAKRVERLLKASEEQFRTMADNIPQLAWMARPDGHIYWYNRRWYEYSGASLETQEGWGWKSLHHPDKLEEVTARWNASLASGEPFDMVFPLKRHDGEFRPFLTRVMSVKDEAGRVMHWFGTNTDITEQRELELQLRQLAAELSEADRRKDEFLATLAHELRNPLAPIRNGLLILQWAGLAPDVEALRAMMERQLEQMVHIVDDLLDVSRVSQGKLLLRLERIDLATAMTGAVETARPTIDAAEHTLAVELPADPIYLDADATRLGQVFSNLLINAAKYSEPGSQIRLSAAREGTGGVAVRVRDSGVGIPTEMLPEIFGMFTQVERTLEKSQGGLGIGLTLVKRLVEMHGGTVEARSDGPGLGSEFIVRLPMAPGPPVLESAPPTVGVNSASARLRILVADDNEDAAATLAMILEILGHDVRTANDGAAAVTAAAAFRPEVVLLDIGMPKLNGYEACVRIRAEPWATAITFIALTGWGQAEDRRRSCEAGFDHHLVKPVDPAALVKLLAGIPKRSCGVATHF